MVSNRCFANLFAIAMFRTEVIVRVKCKFIRSLFVLPVVFAGSMWFQSSAAVDIDWHKHYNDSCQGINLDGAVRYVAERGLKPRKPVTVGIIDSGIDTAHVDLVPSLWVNQREVRNGKDSDRNGYVDDIHGWNFLGTADGSFNMTSAGTEEYREFKRLFPKYKGVDESSVTDRAEYDYYMTMRRKAGIDSYLKFYAYNMMKDEAYRYIDSVARTIHGVIPDTMKAAAVAVSAPDDSRFEEAVGVIGVDLLRAGEETGWNRLYAGHRDDLALMEKRLGSIEGDADKRLLMGDDLKNADDICYGNPCLQASDCEHGTFVAGVIAGQGISDPRVTGIYPQAGLMILRAVPDGDEYDKDVSTAIRYAVDNGARVINMSLGKLTSPDSAMVNSAIAYALRHDVLLVQAAGNSHIDIDPIGYFPSAIDADGRIYDNFIRVAASDRQGNPAPMSNYGRCKVDLFAPGVDITSTKPGNGYMTADGTSIATPVVSAVAAMIRAYFPKLKASQVKDILVRSSRPVDALEGKSRGGIVDAYEAIKMASEY